MRLAEASFLDLRQGTPETYPGLHMKMGKATQAPAWKRLVVDKRISSNWDVPAPTHAQLPTIEELRKR